MPSPGYYDLPGARMLPGGSLSASPGAQGQPRSMSGIDVPTPGSGGPLTGDYRYSIPGAGLSNDPPPDPNFNYNPNTAYNQYIGGFLPLEVGKLIYGGFNSQGTSRDPAIALGRSIAHGFGSPEPDVQTNNDFRPVYGNTASGYPPQGNNSQPDVSPVYGNTANGLPPASAAAQAYSNIARQPNYVDPRSANAFFGGLQAWNGPGQANPTGGEPMENAGHMNMGLARRLGGRGIQGGNTPTDSPAPNWIGSPIRIRGKG